MAFPTSCPFYSLSTFLLVLFTINITPSISITPINKAPPRSNDYVIDICNDQMPDVQFCLGVFKSVPGTSGAKDLKTLGRLTIEFALKKGTDTQTYVNNLVKQTTGKKLQGLYSSCSEYYDEFVGCFNDAKQSFQEGDYQGVNIHASAGLDYVTNCEDDSQGVKDPSQLPQRNKYLDVLSRIILRISNKLPIV